MCARCWNLRECKMSNEFDWEARYMEMVQELPRDAMPGALLEERTVKELRGRGLLRRQRWLPPSWLVGSVAASIALFAIGDRKSTRLNSSHLVISYAVFCLKTKT